MNRRIVKEPGGGTSDIFNSPSSTPPTTPRKVKNYMASSIFTPADNEARSVRQRPDDNSFKKLFGNANGTTQDAPDGGSPRSQRNYQKSNVLFPEGKANGVTNGTNGHLNGKSSLNGDAHDGGSTGTASGSSSGSATPSGSGSICGDVEHTKTNGTSNGVTAAATNGNAANGTNGTHSKRIPPGGFSTKLW